jgi:hypothetical protein
VSEMIPGGTRCARNLPQHFNGCTCTPAFVETAEADIDLDITVADSLPDNALQAPDEEKHPLDMTREELLAVPEFDVIPREWLEPKTDAELAAVVLDSRERKARLAADQAEEERVAAAESARRRRFRRPEWLHKGGDQNWLEYTTEDGYVASAIQENADGMARTRYLVRERRGGPEIATVDRVEQIVETIETHRGTRPRVLTARPSTNLDAMPFSNATTLEALNDHFQGLTSPENISWDGERSGAQVQAELARLQAAYWVRRDEIDPKRERAWCIACRAEVPGVDGQPAKHDNDLGRPCWTGS